MTVGSYSWYNRAVEHIKYLLVVLILVVEKTKYLLVVVIRRWRRESSFGYHFLMGGFVCWWRNLWLLLVGTVLAIASRTPCGVGERNLWLLLLGLLCEGSALNLPQGNYFLDLVLRNLWLLRVSTVTR